MWPTTGPSTPSVSSDDDSFSSQRRQRLSIYFVSMASTRYERVNPLDVYDIYWQCFQAMLVLPGTTLQKILRKPPGLIIEELVVNTYKVITPAVKRETPVPKLISYAVQFNAMNVKVFGGRR
jgi:hypothetical protein